MVDSFNAFTARARSRQVLKISIACVIIDIKELKTRNLKSTSKREKNESKHPVTSGRIPTRVRRKPKKSRVASAASGAATPP